MTSHKEELFKESMRDIFVGQNISGDEGRQSLMQIKSRYFNDKYDKIEKTITDKSEEYQDEKEFEKEIYEKIYDFFNKYFNEYGSVYFSKISDDSKTYEKIYEDNEVKLFWKTHMLYYVKRKSEWNNLLVESYSVGDDKFDVQFDTSKISSDSMKVDELSYKIDDIDDNHIKISILTESKNAQKFDDMRKQMDNYFSGISKEDVKDIISIFQKQNTFDYFITKNCESFLKSQFDLWISQYLLDTETKFSENRISQINDIKEIAYEIIDFISQFEEELKKVWEKKRIVRDTNVVITTDIILENYDSGILEEIIEDDGWKDQVNEWVEMSIIDDKSEIESVGDIKEKSSLPIDSKHFDLSIYRKLSICDDNIDGVLICSENFQAMNTIRRKFKSEIKSIYFDPPYNTGSDSFIYDDRYSRPAWLSFMQDRIAIASEFLKRNGCITAQCDDNEQAYLKILMDEILGEEKFVNSTAVKMSNLSGPKMSHVGEEKMTKLPKIKEYLLSYGNSDFEFNTIKTDIDEWNDEYSRYLTNFDLDDYHAITNYHQNDENIDDIAKRLEDVDMVNVNEIMDDKDIQDPFEWKKDNAYRIVRSETSSSLVNLAEKNKIYQKDQLFYPAESSNGELYIVRTDYNRDVDYPRIEVVFAEDNISKPPGDIWYDINTTGLHNEGNVEFKKGKKPEKLIKRVISLTTDSDDRVMDFFTGSGTTCAVAEKMDRKWIGIDMSDIVQNKSIPRMKRVLAYDESGVSDDDDIRHIYNEQSAGGIFKYFSLEQHEDILRESSYKDSDPLGKDYSEYAKYIFMNDNKLLDEIQTDDNGNVDLTKTFRFIDAAHNISNLKGEDIRDLEYPYVEYESERLDMTSIDINLVKDLFYW